MHFIIIMNDTKTAKCSLLIGFLCGEKNRLLKLNNISLADNIKNVVSNVWELSS